MPNFIMPTNDTLASFKGRIPVFRRIARAIPRNSIHPGAAPAASSSFRSHARTTSLLASEQGQKWGRRSKNRIVQGAYTNPSLVRYLSLCLFLELYFTLF
jgi:hypothetical protein